MYYASITFNFQSREEFEATMRAYVGAKEMVKEAEAAVEELEARVKAKPVAEKAEPKPEPEPKAEKPKAEPTPAAALASIVAAIREWVLADKASHMKQIIPLMPEGKKALDALTLPEAQVLAMKLGVEVK